MLRSFIITNLFVNEATRRHSHLHAYMCSGHIIGYKTESLQCNGYEQACAIVYPRLRTLI